MDNDCRMAFCLVSRCTNTNLSDDVLVGEADDETVLGGVVLVLVLDRETLARVVVGLALAPPLELGLVALEVGAVLDNFNKTHSKEDELAKCIERHNRKL